MLNLTNHYVPAGIIAITAPNTGRKTFKNTNRPIPLLVVLDLDEDAPRPAIVVDEDLLAQLVAAELGQQLGPEQPVNTAGDDDGGADDAVQVVGQVIVDVLVGRLRRDVRRDDEVDVGQQEEDGDGQRGLDRRVPVVLVAVQVEVHEAARDEDVDDSQRVGDDVEDCRSVRKMCE